MTYKIPTNHTPDINWWATCLANVQAKETVTPDKYLASPPDGTNIAREIYYRVVYSLRRLLQHFSRNGLVVLFWPRVEAGVVVDLREMQKEQYRSVIRFLFLEGKSRSEIKEHLDPLYGVTSPLMATIQNWFNEFQHGRTSVFDEPHQGAPKMGTMEDNVTKIHDLVLADCRL